MNPERVTLGGEQGSFGVKVLNPEGQCPKATDVSPWYGVYFFLILTFLFLPAVTFAEIVIEPRVGFRGVFQLGRPFPLEVELYNSGRPAEGILEIQVWKGGASKGGTAYPLYYRREVFLSAQSRKSIPFTVDPDFVSRPLTITLSSNAGQASRELDLRRYFSPAPLMLLVSENNTVLPSSLGSSSPTRLVALEAAELPGDSRALLGVSHLIFYDQSFRDLSRSQLLALDTWLISGGRMVILGSLNYALYQEPTISRFLPVRVTGLRKILSLPGLSQREQAAALTDVWAQQATVLNGRVIIEEQGSPILVETARGKGAIIYLSLDVGRPPLLNWNGLPALMKNLLGPPPGNDPAPRTQWDDAVFSQLILSPSFISSYVPTRSLFLAMLGYLSGIGAFAWLWQRPRWSRRTVVLSFVTFVAVATLGGYLFFSRAGNMPDAVLLSSTIMESITDSTVEAQANVALFSTQIRQYDLQVERGWMDWVPVSSRSKEREDRTVVVQDRAGSGLFQLPLREWDYRLFRVRFVERFPLRAEFEQQGNRLLMKINNQANKDLTDCWLIVSGQRYALGDIPRGASWTKEFPLAHASVQEQTGASRSDAAGLRDVSFKDKTRDFLFHSSFFPREGNDNRWVSGVALFFGWVKEPNRRIWIEDPGVRAYDYSLFRRIVPLAGEEDA